MTRNRTLLCLMMALVANGCTVKTHQINIGQKTSLEKQLMGEVEPLTEEEMLAASVRSTGGVHAGSTDDLTSRAIRARRRQLFNRDDVEELKAAGCLGEALDGVLVTRRCSKSNYAQTASLREHMIEQENQDRGAIIDWALGIDPVLTASDRPQVVELYHRLLVERARPGDWVQQENGRWQQR